MSDTPNTPPEEGSQHDQVEPTQLQDEMAPSFLD